MSRIEKPGRFKPKAGPKKPPPPKVIQPVAPPEPAEDISTPAIATAPSPRDLDPVPTTAQPEPAAVEPIVEAAPPVEDVPAPAAEAPEAAMVPDEDLAPTPPTPLMTQEQQDAQFAGGQISPELVRMILSQAPDALSIVAGEASGPPADNPLFRPASPPLPTFDAPQPQEPIWTEADLEAAAILAGAGAGRAPEASTSNHRLDDIPVIVPSEDEDIAVEMDEEEPVEEEGMDYDEPMPVASQSRKRKAPARRGRGRAGASQRKLGGARSRAERVQLEVDSDDSGYDTEERERHAKKKRASQRQSQRMIVPDDQSDDESSPDEEVIPAPKPRRAPRRRAATDQEDEAGEVEIPAELPPPTRRRSTKAINGAASQAKRGRKRKATPPEASDEEAPLPTAEEAAVAAPIEVVVPAPVPVLPAPVPVAQDAPTPAPSSTATSSPRKKRAKREQTPDTDEEVAPLDLTVVSMADLCGDIKVGRLSQRGVELRQQRKSLKQMRKEARERQKDKVAGRLSETPAPSVAAGAGGEEEQQPEEDEVEEEIVGGAEEEEEEIVGDDEGFRETSLVPQLTLDADGNVVVDQDSLERARRAQTDIVDEGEVLEERLGETKLNSATFSKRKHTARWTNKDVEDLWEFVSMSGLDYLRIALWFGTYEDALRPGVWHQRRTRQQIKKKLDKLSKADPQRFDSVVYGAGRKPFDHVRYAEITGDDAMAEVEDPMKGYWKDLPGQERPNDIPEEQLEAEAKAAASAKGGPEPAAPEEAPIVEEEIVEEEDEEESVVDETELHATG